MSTTIVKTLIRIFPATWGAHLIRRLTSQARRPEVRPEQRAALERATRITYGARATNFAWSWGAGPLVILIHGWNGRAAQFAPLASQLAELGFRCVAMDVTAHGDSAGEHPEWQHFLDDVAVLTTALGGEVFAFVGHSAGGLAMMAARALEGFAAQAYVCVCTPSHPFPPVRAVRERLNPPERVVARYREVVARPFKTSWRELEQGHAFAGAGAELLLVYDRSDRFVDHQEGDRIQSRCPGATLIKTASHGHSKILATRELEQIIGEFLRVRRMNDEPARGTG
jgi:pimeloyl-ACP methyl ester carboxylesterase